MDYTLQYVFRVQGKAGGISRQSRQAVFPDKAFSLSSFLSSITPRSCCPDCTAPPRPITRSPLPSWLLPLPTLVHPASRLLGCILKPATLAPRRSQGRATSGETGNTHIPWDASKIPSAGARASSEIGNI